MPAAGGLRSTVSDMLSFLGASLSPPPAPPGPALVAARQPRVAVGRRMSIGLGWLILDRGERPPVVWHNGGTWGFRSFAAFVPGTTAAAVVLASTARPVDRLGFQLIEEAESQYTPLRRSGLAAARVQGVALRGVSS